MIRLKDYLLVNQFHFLGDLDSALEYGRDDGLPNSNRMWPRPRHASLTLWVSLVRPTHRCCPRSRRNFATEHDVGIARIRSIFDPPI